MECRDGGKLREGERVGIYNGARAKSRRAVEYS